MNAQMTDCKKTFPEITTYQPTKYDDIGVFGIKDETVLEKIFIGEIEVFAGSYIFLTTDHLVECIKSVVPDFNKNFGVEDMEILGEKGIILSKKIPYVEIDSGKKAKSAKKIKKIKSVKKYQKKRK